MGAHFTARIVDLNSNAVDNITCGIPPESAQEAQALSRMATVLQTSIDLPEILQLFFHEARRVLSLDGIHYRHPAQGYEHHIGKVAGHSSLYRLQTHTDFIGELSLHRIAKAFTDEELRRLDKLVTTLVYPVRNGLRYLEAVRASLTDGLTGVGNRISLENALQRETDQANRYQQPLSLLVMDLDHFKTINDRFGHVAGDYVLKMVANTIKASSRCADMTFRFGGEEFVVLLSQTDTGGAKITAERIRRNIESLMLHYDNQRIPISISIGAATMTHSEARECLMQRADKALYQAKKNGRNQVMLAEPALAQAAI